MSFMGRPQARDQFSGQSKPPKGFMMVALAIASNKEELKAKCVLQSINYTKRLITAPKPKTHYFQFYQFMIRQLFIIIVILMGQSCSFPTKNQTKQIQFTDNQNNLQDTQSTNFKQDYPPNKFIQTFRFPQLTSKVRNILSKIVFNLQQHDRAATKQSFIKDKVHYQGTLYKDHIDGYSRILFPDGAYFEGNLVNSQIQGEGVLIGELLDYYVGEFKNNKADGKGKYNCKAFYYQGQFKDNFMQGMGKIQKQDTIFTGRVIKGEKEKGKLIKFKQNLIYEGQFLKDQFNGNGRLQKDSQIYEGYFLNGKLKGKGKYTMRNGNYYVGLFENNCANGYGALYNKDNLQLQSGLWRDNKFIKK